LITEEYSDEKRLDKVTGIQALDCKENIYLGLILLKRPYGRNFYV